MSQRQEEIQRVVWRLLRWLSQTREPKSASVDSLKRLAILSRPRPSAHILPHCDYMESIRSSSAAKFAKERRE